MGQDHLPELAFARAEEAGAAHQVVLPHAVEALAVACLQLRPGALEPVPPGHQRAIVVGAEVVPVLDDEAAFDGGGYFHRRGQLAVGEHVAVDPGIGALAGGGDADGVQQEDAFGGHQPLHVGEVGVVVLRTHVLEHAYRDDLVEAALQVAVVLQQQFHRQALHALLRQRQLFLGYGHAGDFHAVVLGGELGQPAPAAADVQQRLAGLETQLAADHVELGVLGFFQRRGVFPIGAGIDHAAVEHGFEHVVAGVVVLLADFEGATLGLQVEQLVAQMLGDQLDARDTHGGRSQVGAQEAGEQLVKRVAVPLAVHVGLAQAQRPTGEDAFVHVLVMYLDVPGTRAVELHVGAGQQVLQHAGRFGRRGGMLGGSRRGSMTIVIDGGGTALLHVDSISIRG